MSILMQQYLRLTSMREERALKLEELARLQLKIFKEENGGPQSRYHWSNADFVKIDEDGMIECWKSGYRDPDERLDTINFDPDILNGQPEKYRERIGKAAAIKKAEENAELAIQNVSRIAQLERELKQLKGE